MNFVPDLSEYPTWAKIIVAIAGITFVCILIFARKPRAPASRPLVTAINITLIDASGNPAVHLEPDKPFNLVLTFRNSGSEAATSMSIRSCWSRLLSSAEFPDQIEYPKTLGWPGKSSKVIVGAGDTVRHVTLIEPQPATEFKGLVEGATKLYAYGELVYSDLTGRKYGTKYCLIYQPTSGEWLYASKYNEAN